MKIGDVVKIKPRRGWRGWVNDLIRENTTFRVMKEGSFDGMFMIKVISGTHIHDEKVEMVGWIDDSLEVIKTNIWRGRCLNVHGDLKKASM